MVQTPQTLGINCLEAYERLQTDNTKVTDDAMLIENWPYRKDCRRSYEI